MVNLSNQLSQIRSKKLSKIVTIKQAKSQNFSTGISLFVIDETVINFYTIVSVGHSLTFK